MKLIVGLGNPGKQYEKTRHNIGFRCLDFILAEWLSQEDFSELKEDKKFWAEISEGSINGQKTILAKPLTFMNESGKAVQAIAGFYKIEPKDIIVIHDDLDFELGRIEVQSDRSAAGHNGVKSIIERLGTQAFTRIRVGVAKKDSQRQGDTAGFVLKNFGLLERRKLAEVKEAVLTETKKLLS